MAESFANFTIDPEAARIQGIGLKTELSGEYEKAIRMFSCGIMRLSNVDGGLTNPSNVLQIMGIERDLAFTVVRRGLADDDPFSIVSGQRIVEASLGYGQSLSELTGDNYARAAERHLNAEVGASKGVLARIMTVKFIKGIGDDKSALSEQAAEEYTAAAELLADGDNRYFQASNAANFARHLRIAEEGGVAHWLGVAAASTTKALAGNPRNFIPALKTTANHIDAVRTPETALASVLHRP